MVVRHLAPLPSAHPRQLRPQRAATGGSAAVAHGINIALHGLVAMLLARLLARLVSPRAAVAGALLFALVPGHAEAVATVVGRAELLAAAWMLALALLVSRAQAPQPRERGWPRCWPPRRSASKEGGIAAPAIAFAVALAFPSQRANAVRWAASAGAGTLAMLVARLAVLGTLGGDLPNPVPDPARGGPGDARPVAGAPHGGYAGAAGARAHRLRARPRRALAPMASSSRSVPWIVAVVLALLVRHLRHSSVVGVGAWIAAATVAPTADLLFPSGVVLSGRTLYAPAIGAAIIVAGLLAQREPWWRSSRLAQAAGAAGAARLRRGELAESLVWRSTSSAIAVMQRGTRAIIARACTWRPRRATPARMPAALAQFREAARRFPGDPEMLTDGATVALRLRDTSTARAWLERAVAVQPRAARARARGSPACALPAGTPRARGGCSGGRAGARARTACVVGDAPVNGARRVAPALSGRSLDASPARRTPRRRRSARRPRGAARRSPCASAVATLVRRRLAQRVVHAVEDDGVGTRQPRVQQLRIAHRHLPVGQSPAR